MVLELVSLTHASLTTTAMLAALMRLFLKPTSGYVTDREDRNFLVDPGEASSEWNPS